MKPSNTLTGFWMNTVKHFFNHKTLKLFAHHNLQTCSRLIWGNQCAQPVVITGLTVELLGMSNSLNIPSCKQEMCQILSWFRKHHIHLYRAYSLIKEEVLKKRKGVLQLSASQNSKGVYYLLCL